eukprot:6483112-Amphidinium_carterae.2
MLLARPDLLPFTQDKAHATLQILEDQCAPPSKVKTWTTTIRWLFNITGGELLLPVLLRKADSIRERMASTKAPKSKRANPLSMEAVCALEKACVEAPTWPGRLAAGHFRFLLGASARYDDAQHARADTLNVQAETLEFYGWQSKSMRVARSHSQSLPLICPLKSFSQFMWWTPYIQALNQLQSLLPHRDFLLPSPAPDFATFQACPCNREQALRWLRQLLVLGGLTPTNAQLFSLPSLRVFAADLAYTVGIPRDARRYLGRWSEEHTADVYTRDHRTVVTSIWEAIVTKQEAHDPVPLVLTPPVFDNEVKQSASSSSSAMPNAPRIAQAEREIAQSASSSAMPSVPVAAHQCRVCLNMGAPVPMLHWLDGGDRAIGCGWKPKPSSKIQLILTDVEWQQRPAIMLKCSLCFKNRPLHDKWESDLANEAAASTQSSDSCHSS